MIDLFAEMSEVAQALDKAGIRHALAGGLAFCVWVEARNTEDIDILILPEDWPSVCSALAPLGYEALASPMDFAKARIRRLTKLVDRDALVLDCLLADGEYVQGIERAMTLEYRGQSYRVVPPDVLIALKRGRMSPKDISDIAQLEKLLMEKDRS